MCLEKTNKLMETFSKLIENGWKWLKMAKKLKIVEKSWAWSKMVEKGWKWLILFKIVENGLRIVENG